LGRGGTRPTRPLGPLTGRSKELRGRQGHRLREKKAAQGVSVRFRRWSRPGTFVLWGPKIPQKFVRGFISNCPWQQIKTHTTGPGTRKKDNAAARGVKKHPGFRGGNARDLGGLGIRLKKSDQGQGGKSEPTGEKEPVQTTPGGVQKTSGQNDGSGGRRLSTFGENRKKKGSSPGGAQKGSRLGGARKKKI